MRIDVLVIGGGPAGCATAAFLTARGHAVTLVDKPVATRHPQAESLPPSAWKAIDALGFTTAIRDAAFPPWLGNTVWWAGSATRIEGFPHGVAGAQIERGRFDAVLRRAAADAGATLVAGRVVDVDTDHRAVTVETAGGRATLTAACLVDASGRAGVIARHGWRTAEADPRTVSVGAVWHSPRRWPALDATQRTHTLVASYEDGWAWSVPLDDTRRVFTVMVDPARTTLARDTPSLDVYRRELDKAAPLAAMLDNATLVEGPWGADATAYAARRHADGPVLLVGDAGAAIDPLSSFGVKKALASGWLAGVALHTALTDPSLAGAALDFFDRREREVHASFSRHAAAFAADAAHAGAHPYWLARATDDDATAPVSEVVRDGIQAAWAHMKDAPSLAVHRAATLAIAPRPMVRGDRVVLGDHLMLPAWPDGICYLGGVDLIALLDLAPRHRDVGALLATFEQRYPDVAAPAVLTALATLVAQGALVW